MRIAAILARVALLAFAVPALAQEGAAPEPQAPQPPVHITADAAEYQNTQNLVVFTGKVVAVQGDSTLTSERMEVLFTQPEGAAADKPASLAAPAAGRRIASITATQSVTFRQVDPETRKERYATGEKGVYDAATRLVTLTGSPRLWEEKNVIVGEEMVFHLDEKKVVVRGKVNLTVYPDGSQGPKPAP